MIAAGAPPEEIERVKQEAAPPPDEDFHVWPENWDSVTFFLGLYSQWRTTSGMDRMRRTGLDYTAVESTMRIKGIPRKDRAALFDDICVMEEAVLEVWNKQES